MLVEIGNSRQLQEWQIEVNSETGNPSRFLVLLLTPIVLQMVVLPSPGAQSLLLLRVRYCCQTRTDANCAGRAAYICGPYDHIYSTWRTPLLDAVTTAAVVKDKRLDLANVLGPNDD